jgi:tRNA (mo5U34)-methyltransferase
MILPENSPEFKKMQLHELARIEDSYDLILFMGVFYHLRYPMLALDTISRKVRKFMIFQTLTTEDDNAPPAVVKPAENYSVTDRKLLHFPGWPKMAFIEKEFSNDPTHWWVPNHAAVLAMLRSTGFEKVERMAHEIYFCHPPTHGILNNRTWDMEEWLSATHQTSNPFIAEEGAA